MAQQLDLEEWLACQPQFSGSDYTPAFDQERLTGQIRRVFDVMKDGKWRTLREIEDVTGDGQASISAQIRNLKKPEFGGWPIDKRTRGDRRSGLWEYSLILPR